MKTVGYKIIISVVPLLLFCGLASRKAETATKKGFLEHKAIDIITGNRQNILQPLLAQNNQQQSRTALVIGNANYSQGKLNNPVNDANDIATALREVGFEVILLTDADLRKMEEALEQLGSNLKRGGVGLFYYAGHGVQVDGENYLIPLGSQINRAQDVRYEAFPVGKVLGAMEDAGNDLNIVVLDACRDNPYARQWRSTQRGLALVQSATGTLIAYATKPGGLTEDGNGRNGTYTSHLLKHIRTPDLDVELMFKRVREGVLQETNRQQIPWESSSLIGSFAFNSQETEVTPVLSPSQQPENQPDSSETIKDNPVAYNSNFNYVLARNLESHSNWVGSVAISKDRQYIVSGSNDQTIKVWNLNTGELERTLEGHASRVISVAISEDGQRIISGSSDKMIKVWNLNTGELERTLEGHSDWISSVAISEDGQYLVSGSLDKTIKVWNLNTGELERTLEGHNYDVMSVVISRDQQRIVSGSLDKTIKVWNLNNGELEHTLEGHSDGVYSVAISGDGQSIVSGSSDKTIKVWSLKEAD